jgi:regulation of enolase protein 1 (concanavalin A-like superfamily)
MVSRSQSEAPRPGRTSRQRTHRSLWAFTGLVLLATCPLASAFAATLTESTDLGSVDPAGSYTESNGVYTIQGSGGDIEGSSDNGHFVFQRIKGDVTFTAHFVSMEAVNYPWTKMGPMIRASEAEDAQNLFMKITSGVGVRIQGRNDDFPNTQSNQPPVLAMSHPRPIWLRVQRVGQTVSGFYSEDGQIWTSGGVTMTESALPEEALVGIAVTSHQNGELATGVFDNVSIQPGAQLVSGLKSCTGSNGVVLSWSPLKGAESYNVYRAPAGETDLAKFVLANDKAVTSPTFTDASTTLVNNQKYTYAVVPVSNSVEGGRAGIQAAPYVPLAPPGFTVTSFDENPNGDVDFDGGCVPALGAYYNAATGTITLRGSGPNGLHGDVDQFNFTHTEVTGNFQVSAQALTMPTRTTGNARAGLMIREGLTPGARRADLVMRASEGGLVFEWRDAADTAVTVADAPLIPPAELAAPLWLRLTRQGDKITAEYSLDGATWKGADDGSNQVTLTGLAAKVNVGLAITSAQSQVGRQIAEATFKDLKIEPR